MGLCLTTSQTVHSHQSVTGEPIWIIKVTRCFHVVVCVIWQHIGWRDAVKVRFSPVSSRISSYRWFQGTFLTFRLIFFALWMAVTSVLFHHFGPDWKFLNNYSIGWQILMTLAISRLFFLVTNIFTYQVTSLNVSTAAGRILKPLLGQTLWPAT